ncbi:MAG: hypothetical protein ACYTEU_08835, partial [Planctomycetota bacterium]
MALIVMDRFTRWLQGYAANSKASDEIVRDLQRFLGPQVKPQHVYTDNSKEFIAALQELNWPHDTSTPHRPQTNGVIERAVRVVKEGTSCVLVQSGLDEKWWAEAMLCFCFLRNVSLVLETGSTAYKERFGSGFSGPLIPFGAQVEYLPITHADKTKQHAFGSKMRRGIFLGYVQQAGGGWSGDLFIGDWEQIAGAEALSDIKGGGWSGDLLIGDWEQIAGAEALSDINLKRFKSKEVTPCKNGKSFIFPVADGLLRQPGSDPQNGVNSDPFSSSNVPHASDGDDEDDDNWKELEPFDLEDEQQKVDPDAPIDAKDPTSQDFWSFNGEILFRHHVTPRSTLYVPTDSESPIPTKFLDVLRTTYTDLGNVEENRIRDYWNVQGARVLSDTWVGKTCIPLLRKPPPPGWTVIYGRPTKIQKTERPGNLWPEVYNVMSDSQKQKAREYWVTEEPLQKEARDLRGIYVVPAADYVEYDALLKDLEVKLKVPKPPAMPVLAKRLPQSRRAKAKELNDELFRQRSFHISSPTTDTHVERTAPRGHASDEWFACVHTPVDIQKARKIPEGREALEKEWRKLELKKAWDVTKVQPKAKVIRDAKAKGVHVHFGSLMDLCHIKNSQMGKEFWSYKGRIVFRGDLTKDEDGYLAVFTEQGASASNMAAAKFMDAIARMPGNDGEDSDAVGAYTQVRLSDAAKLLGPGVVTETWISLPPYRRPKSWANIVDPVCPLELNLYGHPLAGLLWEIYQEDILMKCGFEKVESWECLYVHRAKQLFLSAYVDDYKMAGKKENIGPMWATLRKNGLELEDAVSLKSNIYLGCAQRELVPNMELLAAKAEMMKRLCHSSGSGTGKPTGSNIPELRTPSESNSTASATPKSKPNKKKKAAQAKAGSTSSGKCLASSRPSQEAANNNKNVSSYSYEMFGHCYQTVEKYLELSGKSRESLKTKATTPCIDDHLIPADEFDERGVLSSKAARIVLKTLYVARIARYDFMWTVNMLAREVTRWTVACDRRLHRLICYMFQTAEYAQICFVGDAPQDCWLTLFSDASFAGDLRDSKSTSGGILCLVGPKTYVPISWICKKQCAVSHSTAEAEVISLDAGVRLEGIPALTFWSTVIDVFDPISAPKKPNTLTIDERLHLRRQSHDLFGSVDYVPPSLPIKYGRATLYAMEDNDSVIKMIVKGRSPNLRHVGRTHRVDLDWLFERINKDPGIFVKWVGTKEQLGDILTKGSFTYQAWLDLLHLSLMMPPSYRKYIDEKLKPLKVACMRRAIHIKQPQSVPLFKRSHLIHQSKHCYCARVMAAASSSASGSSSSNAPLARGGTDNRNIFKTWSCNALEFCQGALKMCLGDSASKTSLAQIPEEDHKQAFSTTAAFLCMQGETDVTTRRSQEKGNDEAKPSLADTPILRWKHLGAAVSVITEHSDALGTMVYDDSERCQYQIGDSTATFKEGNTEPEPQGKGLARAYMERRAKFP